MLKFCHVMRFPEFPILPLASRTDSSLASLAHSLTRSSSLPSPPHVAPHHRRRLRPIAAHRRLAPHHLDSSRIPIPLGPRPRQTFGGEISPFLRRRRASGRGGVGSACASDVLLGEDALDLRTPADLERHRSSGKTTREHGATKLLEDCRRYLRDRRRGAPLLARSSTDDLLAGLDWFRGFGGRWRDDGSGLERGQPGRPAPLASGSHRAGQPARQAGRLLEERRRQGSPLHQQQGLRHISSGLRSSGEILRRSAVAVLAGRDQGEVMAGEGVAGSRGAVGAEDLHGWRSCWEQRCCWGGGAVLGKDLQGRRWNRWGGQNTIKDEDVIQF